MSVDAHKSNPRIATYAEFWPYYLREHAAPACRALHYAGTSLVLVTFALGLFVNAWWFAAAPVVGYAFAWIGHFTIEKNKPATFTYPVWSLISDFRMFFAWITGRLGPQLEEAGVN